MPRYLLPRAEERALFHLVGFFASFHEILFMPLLVGFPFEVNSPPVKFKKKRAAAGLKWGDGPLSSYPYSFRIEI